MDHAKYAEEAFEKLTPAEQVVATSLQSILKKERMSLGIILRARQIAHALDREGHLK